MAKPTPSPQGPYKRIPHWHAPHDIKQRRASHATIVEVRELVGLEVKEMAMRQPTLFLTVGLPATGKTTAARRLEADNHALRLTKDEWMKALYLEQNPPTASDVIEGRLVAIALRALELGISVVIDFGLWGRDERSALRQAAADRGASVEMHYFEVSAAEQRRRLDQRQADEPHTTWPIADEELTGWADVMQVPAPGEIDGSEPIDGPPLNSDHGTNGARIAGRRPLHDRNGSSAAGQGAIPTNEPAAPTRPDREYGAYCLLIGAGSSTTAGSPPDTGTLSSRTGGWRTDWGSQHGTIGLVKIRRRQNRTGSLVSVSVGRVRMKAMARILTSW